MLTNAIAVLPRLAKVIAQNLRFVIAKRKTKRTTSVSIPVDRNTAIAQVAAQPRTLNVPQPVSFSIADPPVNSHARPTQGNTKYPTSAEAAFITTSTSNAFFHGIGNR